MVGKEDCGMRGNGRQGDCEQEREENDGKGDRRKEEKRKGGEGRKCKPHKIFSGGGSEKARLIKRRG